MSPAEAQMWERLRARTNPGQGGAESMPPISTTAPLPVAAAATALSWDPPVKMGEAGYQTTTDGNYSVTKSKVAAETVYLAWLREKGKTATPIGGRYLSALEARTAVEEFAREH